MWHLIKKLLKALFTYPKMSLRMTEAEELFNIIPLKLLCSIMLGKLRLKLYQVTQLVRDPVRPRTQVS